MQVIRHIKIMTSQSREDAEITTGVEDIAIKNTVLSQFQVVKQYPTRGDWTLHQLVRMRATSFMCSQCSRQKTAKLIAIRHNNDLCCNACYGQLLSRK
jgi:hypothetical protein